MQTSMLDELDKKILHVIKDHARLSYSEIGERVGVSRVAVKNHMESMEKRGVIKGYQTIITSQPKTTETITFFMDVTTTIESYDTILTQFKECEMLRQVYATTGECRIHVVGVAPNAQKVQNFVNNLYRNTEGMKRMECHTVLSTIKDVDGGVEDGEIRNESEAKGDSCR